MNNKETLDAFFRVFAHAFVVRAAEGFRDFGRGLLLIGFADPGTGPMGPGWCRYVPLGPAQKQLGQFFRRGDNV